MCDVSVLRHTKDRSPQECDKTCWRKDASSPLRVDACLFAEDRLGSQCVLRAPGNSMFDRKWRPHVMWGMYAAMHLRRGFFMLGRMSAAVL